MTTQRRHFRMPVSRYGLVTKEHTTTLCAIVDITEQGLHFSTDLLLSRNETVRIECQLDADCIIQCDWSSRMKSLLASAGGLPSCCPSTNSNWQCSFSV